MTDIGVYILGFTLFVFLFFTVATIIYVPKALGLGNEDHGDDEESDGHTA
jgi:hypothetical protein